MLAGAEESFPELFDKLSRVTCIIYVDLNLTFSYF